MKKKYHIKGMHCKSCEILLEKSISQIDGVKKVNVSERTGAAEVEFEGTAPQASDELVASAVREAGYTIGNPERLAWFSRDPEEWVELLLGASALFFVWMTGSAIGVWHAFGASFSATPTYPIVFVIGLTAGISTCMALVGGLVAGFSASYAETHQYAKPFDRFKPNLSFHAGRLVSYALLGGAIGALGSAVKLSNGVTGFLIAVAGLVMLYMGLKLIGVSPRFSNMSFTLPKRIGRAFGIREQRNGYSHGEAFLGGAATFFLPCGFTQAMQLYAMTTGSFAKGAVIMFLFALGTTPGLLGVGALTSFLEGRAARVFFRFVGAIVLVLGFVNFGNGLTVSGANFSWPSFGGSAAAVAVPIVDGEQVVNMTQLADGYEPNHFTIKKGIPVKWIIDSKSAYTCAASIRMPAYNVATFLQAGENVVRFTPTQTGPLHFTCGMGMYSGTFTVVD